MFPLHIILFMHVAPWFLEEARWDLQGTSDWYVEQHRWSPAFSPHVCSLHVTTQRGSILNMGYGDSSQFNWNL